MKFLHLADLHLGKRVNGYSMLEDQKYILQEIIKIAEDEKPDALLIAGDVYDRSVPPEEAVDLFDRFLVEVSKRKMQIYIISGNHDSAERVAFGGRLMDESGVHFAPVYDGEISPFYMEDAWGKLAVWMIPFLKPAHVRRYSKEQEIISYTDAMRYVLEQMDVKESERNVLLAHQFLMGGSISDSEEHVFVGGTEEVDAQLFEKFDYLALGHLHRPQKVWREYMRYAGSPLKYSFSEVDHQKSVALIELREKGSFACRLLPLKPRRDLVRKKGTFEEIMGQDRIDDYCEIILTDEEDVPNAITRLRSLYPNFMSMRYDNTRTRSQSDLVVVKDVENKSPLTLFEELYQMQNGQTISEEQKEYLSKMIEELWEEEA